MTLRELRNFAVFGTACFVLGILTCLALWKTDGGMRIEPPAVAVTLEATAAAPLGALMAERAPEVAPKPAQAIPAGMKVERVAKVTVKPTAKRAGTSAHAEDLDCAPVAVDVTLASDKQGSRMIFSSPDGKVVDAIDKPAIQVAAPAYQWTAGGSISPDGKRFGGWVHRDFNRLVVGAAVLQERDGGIAPWVSVGFRF